jgi:hypothetical protein
VKNKDGEFPRPIKPEAIDLPKKINGKQQKDQFEPFGIINHLPGCIGAVIIFNECSDAHGNGKNDEQGTHKPGTK